MLKSIQQINPSIAGQIPSAKLLAISDCFCTGPLWDSLLQHGLFDVIMEDDPSRALRRCLEESPNLVLFETDNPGTLLSGVVREIREESNIPLILLTSYKSEGYILEAYQAGIDECISKPVSPAIFHAKLRAWLRRSASDLTSAMDALRVGNIALMPAERAVIIGNRPPVRLTNLEMRLLYIIMNRHSRTVTTDELIQRVWGYHGHADSTVLKNTVYRLRRKIEADQSNPTMIQTVPGIGYKFVPE